MRFPFLADNPLQFLRIPRSLRPPHRADNSIDRDRPSMLSINLVMPILISPPQLPRSVHKAALSHDLSLWPDLSLVRFALHITRCFLPLISLFTLPPPASLSGLVSLLSTFICRTPCYAPTTTQTRPDHDPTTARLYPSLLLYHNLYIVQHVLQPSTTVPRRPRRNTRPAEQEAEEKPSYPQDTSP